MIFLAEGNLSEVNNSTKMLRLYGAWLFSLNVQDGAVAIPPKSRTPSVAPEFSCALVVIVTTAANDENDVIMEVQEIVTYEDNANVNKEELPGYVNIGPALKDSAVSQRIHDIKNFLSRPVLCMSGVWSVNDAKESTIANMPMPSSCFASSVMLREKLRGFYGFRAKMKIRVQLNAQRFQQGRLILHWLPHIPSPERVNHANSHMTFITQQPRIDMDARDSDVELIVPYVNPSLYYNLVSGENPFGTFYLSVYSPLVSVTGSTFVDFSVWCQFEDIEVVYPTISQSILTAQAGGFKSRSGAGPGKVSVTDAELSQQGLGPISGFLNRVSTAAGILGEIPLISSVTQPVSWVSAVLSKSAQALGFSKPTVESVSSKAMLSMYPGLNNTDMPDNSMKLAMSCSNKLQHLSGFAGSDIDEMSIPYLVQIPAYIASFSWSTQMGSGDKLMQRTTNPTVIDIRATSLCSYQSLPTTPSAIIYRTPPVGYISNLFRRWRGSVNYTLKFVKTEFHSGRLMFAFFPGDVSISNITLENSQYCYRQVLDLREASEFTINVPYVSLRPWADTYCENEASEETGMVALFVLNPLRAPETVSQMVDVLLEVSGGPDMEFQWPKVANWAPILITGNTTSGFARIVSDDVNLDITDDNEEGDLVGDDTRVIEVEDTRDTPEAPHLLQAQSGLSTGPSDVSGGLSSIPINRQIDNDSSAKHIEPAAYCSGESVTSLRQLVKRFSSFGCTPDSSRSIFIADPFAYSILGYGYGTIKMPTAAVCIDQLSYIACMYAFDRGGVRFKYRAMNSATAQYMQTTIVPSQRTNTTLLSPFSFSTGAYNSNGNGYGLTDNRVLALPTLNGGLEIEIPAYQRTHSRYTRNLSGNISQLPRLFNDGDVSVVISQSNAQAGFDLKRAAADDYSCGFFVGVPALCARTYTPLVPQ